MPVRSDEMVSLIVQGMNVFHPNLNIHRLSSCIWPARIAANRFQQQETGGPARGWLAADHERTPSTSPGPRHPFSLY